MSSRPLPYRLAVVIGVVLTCVPAAAQEQSGPFADRKNDKQEDRQIRVFELRHVDPVAASGMLNDLYRDLRDSYSIAIDQRTNSLVLSAPADFLETAQALLKQLDAPAARKPDEGDKVRYFQLKHGRPEGAFVQALELVLPHFAYDEPRGLLVARMDERKLDEVKDVLDMFDRPAEPNAETMRVQIRVVWLVSGPMSDETLKQTSDAPNDLKDVVAELAEIGVTNPRLAAQLVVHASGTGQVPFHTEGTARLDSLTRIALQGTIGSKADGMFPLEIEIQAKPSIRQRDGFYGTRSIASVQTSMKISTGHYVLLGVTPSESLTSVFVVNIQRAP